MKNLTDILDRVANELEAAGHRKLAFELDTVANALGGLGIVDPRYPAKFELFRSLITAISVSRLGEIEEIKKALFNLKRFLAKPDPLPEPEVTSNADWKKFEAYVTSKGPSFVIPASFFYQDEGVSSTDGKSPRNSKGYKLAEFADLKKILLPGSVGLTTPGSASHDKAVRDRKQEYMSPARQQAESLFRKPGEEPTKVAHDLEIPEELRGSVFSNPEIMRLINMVEALTRSMDPRERSNFGGGNIYQNAEISKPVGINNQARKLGTDSVRTAEEEING